MLTLLEVEWKSNVLVYACWTIERELQVKFVNKHIKKSSGEDLKVSAQRKRNRKDKDRVKGWEIYFFV